MTNFSNHKEFQMDLQILDFFFFFGTLTMIYFKARRESFNEKVVFLTLIKGMWE